MNRVAGPAIELLTRSSFLSAAHDLDEAMSADVETRRTRQLELLNQLLLHACETVPRFRDEIPESIARSGLECLEDLRLLPLTTKRDLTSGFPDHVTSSSVDRDDWKYAASSGTVDRVVTVMDFERRDLMRSGGLHGWRAACGYRPGMPCVQIAANICNVVCGTDASNESESFRREFGTWAGNLVRRKPTDASTLRGAYERRIYYRLRMMDPLVQGGTDVEPARLEDYWNRVRAERPMILHALPEYLMLLADYAHSVDKPPLGVPYLMPMGGLVSPAMRRRIERGLGGVFLDFYGTAELGPIAFASASEPDCGMHVIHEQFIIEVVDDDGPVPLGTPGRLVITDLWNRAMPFLRYEVGDVAVLEPAPLGSSDRMPRLRLLGRADECLAGDDGRLVTGSEIRDLMIGELGCRAFRMVERSGNRADVDYIPGEREISRVDVERVLKQSLGERLRLRVRAVRSIAAEKSGKFRCVRRDSPAGARR